MKSDLVKIELHVPKATYGNYEKLRQFLKKEDIPTMIYYIIKKTIRETLGCHYVPVEKEVADLLKVKAQQKDMELNELATQILKSQLREGERV